MAVIEGGTILSGGVVMEGVVRRPFAVQGAPVAGTTLAGVVAVGDLVVNVANGQVFEYTEPGSSPTFTRIDTV